MGPAAETSLRRRAALIGVGLAIACSCFGQSTEPIYAAPSMPIGTSPAFQQRALKVEEAIFEGHFDEAKKLVASIQGRELKLAWNDAHVPDDLKVPFAVARDHALRQWSAGLGIRIEMVDPATPSDLKISFERVLQTPAGKKAPYGLVIFEGGSNPKVEAVIGLHRGAPLAATSDVDVTADVEYAIGRAIGLADSTMPGSVMDRSDEPLLTQNTALFRNDQRLASRIFEFMDSLNRFATEKMRMRSGQGKLFYDPKAFATKTPVLQGQSIDFVIQITNLGNAILSTELMPDCSCFTVDEKQVDVRPDGTGLWHVHMSTIEYGGTITKTLYLSTSDPNQPFLVIPVRVQILPRYEFISPNGNSVLLNKHGGTEVVMYLAVNGHDLGVNQAEVAGMNGATVTYEPWSGVLAAPDFGEAARPRKGYKLTIRLPDAQISAPQFVGLNIGTSDSTFRVIRQTLTVQYGIVALPNPLYVGNLAAVARTFSLRLRRPRKDFHVLALSCDNPHFKISQKEPKELWDREIIVTYDGKAGSGDIGATIKIRTDDKEQPVINVPIQGTTE